MVAPITVSTPTVRETQVTVKNVMIGKRQLTLRVFRQIQVEPFLDMYSGKVKGEIWGYVNEFWKENEDHKNESKHILWVTVDGELRRAFITPRDLYANPFENKLKYGYYYDVEILRKAHSNDLILKLRFNKSFRPFLDHFNVKNVNPTQPFIMENGMIRLQELLKRRAANDRRWKNTWYLYTKGRSPNTLPDQDYRDVEYFKAIAEFYPDAIKYLKGNMLIICNTLNLCRQDYRTIVLPELHKNYKHYHSTLEQLYIAV